MASLLELSHELLHCILTFIEPVDLASLSRSCQDLNRYIKGNRMLHKDLYLRRYDEPQCLQEEPDWEQEVHNLVKLEKLLESPSQETKADHLEFVAAQVESLIKTAHVADLESSRNLQSLRRYFKDDLGTDNIDALLCSSSLFARAGNERQQPALRPELRQASAKLHCLYGVPVDRVSSRRSFSISRPDISLSPSACTRLQSRPRPTHNFARSKVYDLRKYTDNTLWGPFMDDGSQRVDWEKMEAIMVVLGFNMNKFTERSEGSWPTVWHTPFVGATPNSYVSAPTTEVPVKALEPLLKYRELAPSLDAQDPYGVSGTWFRVVCFLDYRDLYAFNFSPDAQRIPPGEERPPIDIEEAIRLIEVKLQVTKIEPPGSDDEDDEMAWSNFTGKRLPIVRFKGSSKSLHASWDPNANSMIRGTARQTPEGEIRWTTFHIFHGEERWRSEGIQVGGLKSARGVLGNWFDKDYDMEGPAGPTAYWKVSDGGEDDKNRTMPLAFY